MLEMLVRVGLGLGLAVFSFLAEFSGSGWCWRIGLVVASLGVLSFLMERRGLRTQMASAWIAVLDAAAIASILGSTGNLSGYGAFVLVPCAYASARFRANPALMSPLAAAMVFGAANVFGLGPVSVPVLASVMLILAVGLLLNQGSVPEEETEPAQIESPVRESVPQGYLVLRESYRKLRSHSVNLERNLKRYRAQARISQVSSRSDEPIESILAQYLRESLGVQGTAIHTVSSMGSSLVVRAASGQNPERLLVSQVDVSQSLTDSQALRTVREQLRSTRDPNEAIKSGSVLLKEKGRLIGLVTLSDPNPTKLQKAISECEELATPIAVQLAVSLELADLRRRLEETELLYTLAGVEQGAESPANLLSRVVRELGPTLQLDYFAASIVDSGSLLQIAAEGTNSSFIESLSFGPGFGSSAWLAAGGPEAHIEDAASDPRIDRVEALKRRVGSCALVPIHFGKELYGVLMAANHRGGALDYQKLQSLRAVAAELAHALARLEEREAAGGLMTPKEFQQRVADMPSGLLVYFEPTNRDEAIQQFGAPSFEIASREVARKVRAQLPVGGFMCRRSEGDFIVFLSDFGFEDGSDWAGQVAAGASLTPIKTPSGRAKIPYGLKFRVAEHGQPTVTEASFVESLRQVS